MTTIRVDCQSDKAEAVKSAMEKDGAEFIEQLTSNSTGETVFIVIGDSKIMFTAMGAGASASFPLS